VHIGKIYLKIYELLQAPGDLGTKILKAGGSALFSRQQR
jgi:hypothetical protein